MPEIILKFKLPDEKSDLVLAQKGGDLYGAIHEFNQWLRSEVKYNNKPYIKIREMLWEILENYNIDLDNLVE